jgi:AcrR family transcriptional regulator
MPRTSPRRTGSRVEATADTPAVLGLRERKKAKTKAAIQHHALRLFEEQGYAETTVEQIAAAAEVSPSTFFRYFPTKDDTVLTDLVDAETFEIMLAAPAELSPLQALSYAVERTFASMTDEDLDHEITRNRLIRSVPELRRGQLAEMTRPMELLTEAVARRLGRSAADVEVRMYAGAVVGALMAAIDQDTVEVGLADARGMMGSVVDLIGRLDRFMQAPSADAKSEGVRRAKGAAR